MGFSRQEYWSGFPFPSPGDFPHLGTEPLSLASPALAGSFFTISHLGSPNIQDTQLNMNLRPVKNNFFYCKYISNMWIKYPSWQPYHSPPGSVSVSVLPASLVGEGGPWDIRASGEGGERKCQQEASCCVSWVLPNRGMFSASFWGKRDEVKATPCEDSPASRVKTAFMLWWDGAPAWGWAEGQERKKKTRLEGRSSGHPSNDSVGVPSSPYEPQTPGSRVCMIT